jgi:hypothetical protein
MRTLAIGPVTRRSSTPGSEAWLRQASPAWAAKPLAPLPALGSGLLDVLRQFTLLLYQDQVIKDGHVASGCALRMDWYALSEFAPT